MAKYPKTIIATTAQAGGEPFGNFLEGLQKRAGKHGEVWILPTNGSATGKAAKDEGLHKYFLDKNRFRIIESNMPINANCYVMRDITVRAEAANPIDKSSTYVSTGKTAVITSPKIRLKVYADTEEKRHKILTSTGAATHPNYTSNTRGQPAKLDHQYGAVIVEVEDNQKFHFRQLNADETGVFYDLGVEYNGNKKPKPERLEALVLGDWHEGYNPLEVINGTEEMIEELQPKRIIIHDLFDGDAISFFHEKDILTKARQVLSGTNLLSGALQAACARLARFRKICPEDTEIYVDKSNHDERLFNYVKEMKYKEDIPNSGVGSRLYTEMYENDEDPLIIGLKHYGGKGKLPPGVHFLQRQDSLTIAGWTVSAHGDKGPNGRKASTLSLSKSYNAIIAGHGHYPEIFRNVFRAGTSTYTWLNYTLGSPSNWMNTHVSLPSNGHPQLINLIDGRYRPV